MTLYTPQVVAPQCIDPSAGTGSDDTAAIQGAVDQAFGTAASPHGMSAWQNVPLYFPPPPSGLYRVMAPIAFPPIFGGKVYGTRAFNVRIQNTGPTGGVFAFKSLSDSEVSGIWFGATDPLATLVDQFSDGSVFVGQRNLFADLYMQGGAIGLRIRETNNGQGSENALERVFGNACGVGVSVESYNALGNRLEGGNFQMCGQGVHLISGGMHISGTGFQGSTVRDITYDNSADSSLVVCGVRTESKHFVKAAGKRSVLLQGCEHHTADVASLMFEGDAQINVQSCVSGQGKVYAQNGGSVSNSQFGRNDPFTVWPSQSLFIDHVQIGKTWNGTGTGTPAFLERGRWNYQTGFFAAG